MMMISDLLLLFYQMCVHVCERKKKRCLVVLPLYLGWLAHQKTSTAAQTGAPPHITSPPKKHLPPATLSLCLDLASPLPTSLLFSFFLE
jgi:hypothetical protein